VLVHRGDVESAAELVARWRDDDSAAAWTAVLALLACWLDEESAARRMALLARWVNEDSAARRMAVLAVAHRREVKSAAGLMAVLPAGATLSRRWG
jgi:hypothetical protein